MPRTIAIRTRRTRRAYRARLARLARAALASAAYRHRIGDVIGVAVRLGAAAAYHRIRKELL